MFADLTLSCVTYLLLSEGKDGRNRIYCGNQNIDKILDGARMWTAVTVQRWKNLVSDFRQISHLELLSFWVILTCCC